MQIHFALISHWGGGRLKSSCISLSGRCLSDSDLSFAGLCSVSPDISHSCCSCSPFVFQCAKAGGFFCLVLIFFLFYFCFLSLPNCCFFSWRSNCPSSNWMLLQVGWLLCIPSDYENPAVELKELKSLFRKENHNFLLPARKAVGLHLQVTRQGFKKKNWILASFFFLVLRWSKLAWKMVVFWEGLCLP